MTDSACSVKSLLLVLRKVRKTEVKLSKFMWVNTQLQFLAREKPSVISYYIHLLSKKLPKKQIAIPLSVFIVNMSSKG